MIYETGEVYSETEEEVETAAEGEPAEEGDEPATAGDLEPEEPMPVPVPEPGYDDWWTRPITQEMADMITACVKGAVQVSRDQTEVMAIVQEEAGAFFAGQKTAQAVAETIQSRVYLYVMESR